VLASSPDIRMDAVRQPVKGQPLHLTGNVGGYLLFTGVERLGYYSDQARSEVRIDTALAATEYERRAVNSHHAATLVAIHSVLDEARFSPDLFVGGRASRADRDDVEFSERAAIADLAVRLARSENTIRAHEHQAVTMIARTPITRQKFRWGEVTAANARRAAEHATRPAPERFRASARKLREQLVSDTAAERHDSQLSQRRIVFEPDIDGMPGSRPICRPK
jgi:acyl transferase domain-containing protein